MDGRYVLALCDYNIACEVRLLDAVDRGWLSPFQYFAVYDETDYEQIARLRQSMRMLSLSGEGVQGTMIFIKNRLDKRGRLRYYT